MAYLTQTKMSDFRADLPKDVLPDTLYPSSTYNQIQVDGLLPFIYKASVKGQFLLMAAHS